ncbi:unnamed protein product [Ceutorhynchus assimilis]|uniref:Chitin-binding type-2 domain-containing protein n=1 Tax=Ceutorhynchus assimilis TaxID=467358 RepID=A0A9P0DFY8_9CUCU|nr:unnamed protein product [Ceutorhynchus assimilis]
MPNHARMKILFLEGLLWLFLLQYGPMALSLEPGYLDFDNLPDTNFTCVGKVIGGYYADLETNCQMFHVCTIGQAEEPMDIRFLCLNGTVFDQETRVCERIDEVDCSKSEQFYSLNLELYGNSGPILEETPEVPHETEPPSIIVKSTTSTTTTTTTTKRPTTQSPYYTTIRPSTATTSVKNLQSIGHHFPVNTPDIRFNPEEINISLNPGAPPDIRTKHFQPHQSYSDSSKHLLSDHRDNSEEQSVRVQKPERLRLSTSPKPIYIDPRDKLNENSGEENYDFSEVDFHSGTEVPRQQQFLIQTNSFRHSQSFPPSQNTNNHQYHHPQFHSTTIKHPEPIHTTVRTLYLHSLKPPEIHQHHQFTQHRTEKSPQRVQIPIPLLPTLPPLTFSSPAPFTLQRHIETKRYTKDHSNPPRIIISASASVSDASGRRLNYSLGTIGAAHILETPPSSYDEYKDADVGLDPFYHDVPKIKQRKKRSIEQKKVDPFDIIKNEKEAVEVLKFLFTWYQSHQATATVPPVTSPVSPELIKKINDELAPDSNEYYSREPTSTESVKPDNYEESELFKKSSRFSIVGGYRNDNPVGRRERKKSNSAFKEVLEQDGGELSKETDISYFLKQNDDKIKHFSEDIRSKEFDGEAELSQSLNKTEITEKMDNVEKTFIKDAKESYINPFDYVDDNYEGVVYKESNKNIENANYISKGYEKDGSKTQKETEHFVDPSAVLELYKYVQVNSQLASATPTIKEKELEATKHSPESNNEDVEQNNTSEVNLNRYTEINILSEVNEDNGSFRSISSSTTITTSTAAPIKHTLRRRGRQRITDSDQGASYAVHVNQKSQNSLDQTRSRGRHRGRSRFSNPLSSTTSSTTTTEKIVLEETTTSPSETTLGDFETTTFVTPSNEAITTDEEANNNLENSTTSEITDQNGKFVQENKNIPDKEIVVKTNPIKNSTETSAVDTKTIETKLPKDDSSYLVKLLKYYADADLTPGIETTTQYLEIEGAEVDSTTILETTTTQLPEVSYEPLTEKISSSTLPPSTRQNNDRSKYRHSTKVSSSTALPTLRDIYESTKPDNDNSIGIEESKDAHKRDDLLKKLSLLEQHLVVTNPPIADTTATTPMISFEERESFGTTVSSLTESTRLVEYSTSSKEFTGRFEYSSTPRSVYHDLFIVPELTEKNLKFQINEATSSLGETAIEFTAIKTTTQVAQTDITTPTPISTITVEENLTETPTTPLSDVEIQKSISLPIQVLETNFDAPYDVNTAQDINSLVPATEEEKTTTILDNPTTLTHESTTETIPATIVTTEKSTTPIVEQHLEKLQDTTMPEVQHNATEIIFLSTGTETPGMVNSSHLLQVVIETTTISEPVTTFSTTTSLPYTRRTRPPKRRPYNNQRNQFGRHRFSTELFTQKPFKTATEAPLHRSASPTRSENKKNLLPTVPLTSKNSAKPNRHYVFNCFGKEINKFYADPRDCRLFHYCTQGYSKNQLLDLKYVCDQRTFFDEDKLICTSIKPDRCL